MEVQTYDSRRPAPRLPLVTEVEIRFEEFDDFVTEYSGNISTTGMFIKTVRPQPPGTMLQFELEVEGGWRVIRGAGEVVWTRRREEAAELPPGMGVRFISLAADSRKMIAWMIERSGGAGTFDADRPH